MVTIIITIIINFISEVAPWIVAPGTSVECEAWFQSDVTNTLVDMVLYFMADPLSCSSLSSSWSFIYLHSQRHHQYRYYYVHYLPTFVFNIIIISIIITTLFSAIIMTHYYNNRCNNHFHLLHRLSKKRAAWLLSMGISYTWDRVVLVYGWFQVGQLLHAEKECGYSHHHNHHYHPDSLCIYVLMRSHMAHVDYQYHQHFGPNVVLLKGRPWAI